MKRMLLAWLLVLLMPLMVAAQSFPYDPAAEPDLSLNGKQMFGYLILFFPNYDFMAFRDINDAGKEYAKYNWRQQWWSFKSPEFKPVNLDLAKLYKKIDLSKTTLDRPYPQTPATAPLASPTVSLAPLSVSGSPSPQPSLGPKLYPYDENAEINFALQDTIVSGMKLDFNRVAKYVYFRDTVKPVINYGTYDLGKQFWLQKPKEIDASFNLATLFTKIDLSKTVLDRFEPQEEKITADFALEATPYDYSNDKDFAAFVAWMKARKVPQATIDFYAKAASNPGKRGKLLPWGLTYGDRVVGIQAENMKPIKFKGIVNGSAWTTEDIRTVGGMQFYFEMRKGLYVRNVDVAYNTLRDNKIVPVTLVLLERNDGKKYTAPKLQGKALTAQVQTDLEKAIGKRFAVSQLVLKVNYKELEDIAPCSQHESGLFMDKYVHPKIPKNTIVIYYYNDLEALFKIDDQYTHPLTRGPYGGDWEKRGMTMIHELGHSIAPRHHFDSEVEGSSDIARHISPKCIMNYRFSGPVFCELCKYSFGL